MFRHHLKLAFRNLARNKVFTFFNLGGLSVGMASAALIFLLTKSELTYDRFYEKIERLYQVWSNDTIEGTVRSLTYTPEMLAPELQTQFPEVEEATRVSFTRNVWFVKPDQKFFSTGAIVDKGFFKMFSFQVVSGSMETALNDPHSMVVTQSMAKRVFGTANAIGKSLTLGKSQQFKVTAVLKDLPDNTQFDFYEYFLPYSLKELEKQVDGDWTNISVPTFVLLKKGASLQNVNRKIKDIISEHSNGTQLTQEFLYPFSELRLHGNFENGRPVGGGIVLVRTFMFVAILILMIACINLMNLSTARSQKRAKEVGVKKAAGASRASIVTQFLVESVLIALISGIFAVVIIHLALPQFNLLFQKNLIIDYGDFYFWLYGGLFVIVTGLLAGSYPAFFLSSFKPATALKGTGSKKSRTAITSRQTLVVLQFTATTVLIGSTIAITRQTKFGQDPVTYPADSQACLINESALRIMRFNEPIGQIIADGSERWRVVGVIRPSRQQCETRLLAFVPSNVARLSVIS